MRFQAVVFDFVSGQGEGRIQESCCFLKVNKFCSGAVAHETGGENIKVRMVSARLQCSTQPVMHHFATIEALKWAVYAKAMHCHSEYRMNLQRPF